MPRLYNLIIYFTFLFCFGASNGFGASQDSLIVLEDLSDELLVYDENYKTFVPYLGGTVSSYSIHKDFRSYADYQLSFSAHPGLTLFADYKLIYENVGDAVAKVTFPIIDITHTGNQKTLLTFYHSKASLPRNVEISHSSPILNLADVNELQIQYRNPQPKESLFILFMIVFSGFIILKIRFPKKLSDYIGLSRAGNAEDNISLLDFFSGSSLLIISVNSISMAYIYSVVNVSGGQSFSWFNISFLFFFIFIGFYLKYLILVLFGSIFSLNTFYKYHFLEIVRITLVFNLVTVPLVSLVYFSELIDLKISYMGFLSGLITALVIVLFKLIVLTFRVPDFKYIYLFSYLCMAELIPLGFAIKITLL